MILVYCTPTLSFLIVALLCAPWPPTPHFASACAHAYARRIIFVHTTALTRTVMAITGLPPEDRRSWAILAPFADFFNHKNGISPISFSYGYNDTTRSLEVRAMEEVPAGGEVFISYGILTNPDLLSHYGFVLPNNRFETVGFKLGLRSDDIGRKSLLSAHGLDGANETVSGMHTC